MSLRFFYVFRNLFLLVKYIVSSHDKHVKPKSMRVDGVALQFASHFKAVGTDRSNSPTWQVTSLYSTSMPWLCAIDNHSCQLAQDVKLGYSECDSKYLLTSEISSHLIPLQPFFTLLIPSISVVTRMRDETLSE